MIVYLAGDVYARDIFPLTDFRFNRLDSFIYVRNNEALREFIPRYRRYILDSGAFTFMMQKKRGGVQSLSIDSFTDEYIEFISAYGIDHFFEMDVDVIFGYGKVKELRRRIESRTGKPTIPVFHMSRGLEDWKAMCRDYQYIALGIGGKDVAFTDVNAFRRFNDSAMASGCRVHCLGVTGMTVLDKVPFYSVDSSSWTTGNRYKYIHHFSGGRIRIVRNKHLEGKRIYDHKGLATHNLNQWISFSDYAENNY